RGLARARRPDDRHQLARAHGERDTPQRGHGRLLAVDLGHPVQLEDGAHRDGTATRSPARRSPSTCTRPPPVSNRPRVTATRSRRPPRTSSTAKPPPDRPTSAVTGTLSALATPAVVMSTPTGALSNPRARPGSSRLMYVATVASAAVAPCSAGV